VTGDGGMFLSDSLVTLAETLRDAGWVTAGYVTNPVVDPSFGLAQGFDRYDRVYTERDLPYPHAPLLHARALNSLKDARAAGRPAFVFLNHMEPHLPYTAPADMEARFAAAGTGTERAWARGFRFPAILEHNLGLTVQSAERLALLSDQSDAEIATLDREIGAFVDALRTEDLLDRTLFVVVADHGENLGDHGLVDHMFSVHRSLLHVPLVVRYPGRFEGGRTVGAQVRLEDIHATILDVCGLAQPKVTDGLTLCGDVRDRVAIARLGGADRLVRTITDMHADYDTTVVAQTYWSVHSGGLHWIGRGDGKEWLYDVTADPLERSDLRAARASDAARLRALLPSE
jgi:arylsulfatase A-like enzyme